MTSIPVSGDGSQPRKWSISNRPLILSAGSRRVLAVLNGHDPLPLPPGSVLQFDDPPGELVVTGIRVVGRRRRGNRVPRGRASQAMRADVLGRLRTARRA